MFVQSIDWSIYENIDQSTEHWQLPYSDIIIVMNNIENNAENL